MKENEWTKERALMLQQMDQLQARMTGMANREKVLKMNQKSLTEVIQKMDFIQKKKESNAPQPKSPDKATDFDIRSISTSKNRGIDLSPTSGTENSRLKTTQRQCFTKDHKFSEINARVTKWRSEKEIEQNKRLEIQILNKKDLRDSVKKALTDETRRFNSTPFKNPGLMCNGQMTESRRVSEVMRKEKSSNKPKSPKNFARTDKRKNTEEEPFGFEEMSNPDLLQTNPGFRESWEPSGSKIRKKCSRGSSAKKFGEEDQMKLNKVMDIETWGIRARSPEKDKYSSPKRQKIQKNFSASSQANQISDNSAERLESSTFFRKGINESFIQYMKKKRQETLTKMSKNSSKKFIKKKNFFEEDYCSPSSDLFGKKNSQQPGISDCDYFINKPAYYSNHYIPYNQEKDKSFKEGSCLVSRKTSKQKVFYNRPPKTRNQQKVLLADKNKNNEINCKEKGIDYKSKRKMNHCASVSSVHKFEINQIKIDFGRGKIGLNIKPIRPQTGNVSKRRTQSTKNSIFTQKSFQSVSRIRKRSRNDTSEVSELIELKDELKGCLSEVNSKLKRYFKRNPNPRRLL